MYRRHFLLLAGTSVVFSIPLAALAGFGIFALVNQLVTLGSNNVGTSTATPDFASLGPSIGALAAGTLINLAILPLMYGAVSYAVCEAALGHPVTVWASVRGGLKRYFGVAGYVLIAVLMGLAFCLFPLWIWILVGWLAVLPVMFVEKVGLGAAMGRSWKLVQGRWWRTFLILLLMFVLNYVVSLALEAFLYLGQILLSLVLSPYLSLAIYEGGVVLVNALTIPIFQIAITLIYFDLRVRKEGLDLFQLAQRVAALPPAPA